MPFFLKLLITNGVIVSCVMLGRRYPSLAGLIATMPLTSLLVLVWLRLDNPDDRGLLTAYTRGVLWGIVPTILFFSVAYLCFRRNLPLPLALGGGFAAWLVGALAHQWLVR
ncbi:MAG TPA: DUF3147 family protein [Verrucomicrobiae bacterium]|nr:DUF3147 family protein [Verrucomicrobiae bacterium]